MDDKGGHSRRLVAVLALERSDGARAFVRFAGRFLANGSHPAKMRQAHVPKAERTKRPSASPFNRRSRTQFAALHAHGFAAERRPRIRRIPTAVRWQHEGSRIVHPKITDLAAAVRRLSAARRTRPHVSRSDRTPSPGHACAACRKRPSHADGEIALRCRPRTPPTPQLGAEAAPIQITA